LNEDIGYVLGMFSVYLTTDGGVSWLKKSVGTNDLLYSLYFINQSTGFAVGEGSSVYKTINNGDTWTGYSLSGGVKTSIRFLNDSIGFITTSDGKIFNTENSGSNWSLQESTTNNFLSAVAFLENGLAYAVGNNSTILRNSDYGGGPIVISNSHSQKYVSNNYELLVYPIPAQSSVTLEYKLKVNSQVDIFITDINGLEIKQIEKGKINAGTHKIVVNLNNKKAGIYFCVVAINEQREVAKIIKTNGL